jgi:DHA1 family tetracycline resistance protein-like MFS transporter
MVSQPTLSKPRGSARAPAFGFIFGSAVINAVSFGIMIPILPNLIKQFTHGDTAAASEWNVLFATVWGVMQFICGPILGMLSDRHGRRPVLLVSTAGLFVDFLFMAFAPTLGWLFIGRVLNGVTAASFSTANAYVADIIAPEERAKSFGLMGSAFGFGFIIGPTLGGFLGEVSLRLPFVVAAGLCLINFLYGLFILPESLPPERRTPKVNWSRANPVGSLRFLREHGELGGLALVAFLYQLGFTVLPAIFVLYSGYRYGWTPGILGFTFLATGISQILVATFVVGPVVKRIGERGAALLGLGSGALALLIYALAPTGWIYMTGVPIFALTGLVMPGLQGLMTRRVDPRHQGQLQGVTQSFQGIASMIGPSLFGLTFAWAVRNNASLHQPGLPILIASALLLAGFILSLRVATPAPAAVPA